MRPRSWSSVLSYVFVWGLVSLALLPVLALVVIAFGGGVETWPHLLRYVLPATAWQTFILLVLVAIGTSIVGAGTAWLTTLCRFPGYRIFTWALMLPLAVPVYIASYAQVEVWDYSGPVQTMVREWGGFASGRDYWFPDIRSLGGAGLIFVSVLFPYVYITTRITFSMQGASALDVSRSLGAGPWRMFWRVGLPIARPAILVGMSLALMETLNDIGAVSYLGIRTLTFAMFDTWLNRDNLAGAVQMALAILIIVAALVWLQKHAQRKRGVAAQSRERPPARFTLTPAQQTGAFFACLIPVLMGFAVPLYVLMSYALKRLDQVFDPDLWEATFNSLLVSALTAALAVTLCFAILLIGRISRRKSLTRMGRLTTLGYAIPGTVLAIGLFLPLAAFDNLLDSFMRSTFGMSTGLLLTGSILVVVYACILRFMALAWGAMETGFSRMSVHIDLAARSLGRMPHQVALQVHTPILRSTLAGAFLLVFVDTMKELSATLLVRPFGFNTLATSIFDRASQSSVEEAAVAALIIVLVGLAPVILLTRAGVKR